MSVGRSLSPSTSTIPVENELAGLECLAEIDGSLRDGTYRHWPHSCYMHCILCSFERIVVRSRNSVVGYNCVLYFVQKLPERWALLDVRDCLVTPDDATHTVSSTQGMEDGCISDCSVRACYLCLVRMLKLRVVKKWFRTATSPRSSGAIGLIAE